MNYCLLFLMNNKVPRKRFKIFWGDFKICGEISCLRMEYSRFKKKTQLSKCRNITDIFKSTYRDWEHRSM